LLGKQFVGLSDFFYYGNEGWYFMQDENKQLLCWREVYNGDILFWIIMTEGKYCENFDSVRE
jgi:hypothetical protein